MLIWQEQINHTTTWGSASRWYVPAKDWWNLQRSTKCLSYSNDILIVGYDADGRYQNRTQKKVMQICQQENVKLNKSKCHCWCTKILSFGEAISREGMQPDPKKLHMLTEMLPPNNKKELIILGIILDIKLWIYIAPFKWARPYQRHFTCNL